MHNIEASDEGQDKLSIGYSSAVMMLQNDTIDVFSTTYIK